MISRVPLLAALLLVACSEPEMLSFSRDAGADISLPIDGQLDASDEGELDAGPLDATIEAGPFDAGPDVWDGTLYFDAPIDVLQMSDAMFWDVTIPTDGTLPFDSGIPDGVTTD